MNDDNRFAECDCDVIHAELVEEVNNTCLKKKNCMIWRISLRYLGIVPELRYSGHWDREEMCVAIWQYF